MFGFIPQPRPLFHIGKLPVTVTNLIIIIEVVGAIALAVSGNAFLQDVANGNRTFRSFELYRLVTAPLFTPVGFFWLIGLFFFFTFGTALESFLGRTLFARLVLALVLIQSLFIAALTAVAPGTFIDVSIGAQSMHLGVFLAYCFIMPNAPSFFGNIPVKYVGIAFAALGFFQYLSMSFYASALSVVACCLLAVALVKRVRLYGQPQPKRRSPTRKKSRTKAKVRPRTSVRTDSTEVDRILDKINDQGFQSLTKEERATLDRSSKS